MQFWRCARGQRHKHTQTNKPTHHRTPLPYCGWEAEVTNQSNGIWALPYIYWDGMAYGPQSPFRGSTASDKNNIDLIYRANCSQLLMLFYRRTRVSQLPLWSGGVIQCQIFLLPDVLQSPNQSLDLVHSFNHWLLGWARDDAPYMYSIRCKYQTD